jgi:hypothetical protein
VHNFKTDSREIGWSGMDWIDVIQDRDQWKALVDSVMNLRVSESVWKFLSSCTTGSFSRRAHLHEVSYTITEKKICGHFLSLIKITYSHCT